MFIYLTQNKRRFNKKNLPFNLLTKTDSPKNFYMKSFLDPSIGFVHE